MYGIRIPGHSNAHFSGIRVLKRTTVDMSRAIVLQDCNGVTISGVVAITHEEEDVD